MTEPINVETGMGQTLDSLTSYAVAGTAFLTTQVMLYSPAILTVGSLVLLGLRLYVDGSKAYRTFKRNKDV